MQRTILPLLAAFSGLLASGTPVAAQEVSTDPETGLLSWHWDGGTADFTFNQRLPDQTRAYFQGRGFKPGEAELIASDCVFQAIIRNHAEAQAPLQVDLSNWQVFVNGEPSPLKLERQWQQRWEKLEVQPPARIAFQWSLFPTRQRFAPGDWNMGMITLGLSPGERFDLQLSYRRGDESIETRLRGMQCAEDRQL